MAAYPYQTTFPCGDYTCKLYFDGTVYFIAVWWTDIPQAMTGPMQAQFDAACQLLCQEALVPYAPETFCINSVKSTEPLNAAAA